MEIYKSTYQKIVFNNETSTLEEYWLKPVISPEDYKKELMMYTLYVEQCSPKNVYVDLKNFDMTITPDVQEWIDKNRIVKRFIKAGVKKIAATTEIANMSKQTIEQREWERTKRQILTTEYFLDENKAKQWLSL